MFHLPNRFTQDSKLNAVVDISNIRAMNSGDVSIVNTGYAVKNTDHKHQMFVQRANARNKKVAKSFRQIRKSR